jgi:hypothetical protein
VLELRETADASSNVPLAPKTISVRRPNIPSSPKSKQQDPLRNGSRVRGSYARRSSPLRRTNDVSPDPRNGRTTHNSLSTPVASESPARAAKKLRLSRSRTPPMPDPSRSPTPPKPSDIVLPTNGRRRYSEVDHKFFINCISWELKRDPSLNKMALCKIVAKKVSIGFQYIVGAWLIDRALSSTQAPHHSEQGWVYYWSTCGELADSILDAAKDRLSKEGSNIQGPKDEEGSTANEESSSDDDCDLDVPTDEDERKMGPAGSNTGPPDYRIIARYIAKIPDFHERTQADAWLPFHEKV